MALHWDITKCNEMLELQSDTEWPITNALIWLTMAVDMGKITDTNIGEFYARTKVWEAVTGAMVTKIGDDKDTLEDYFLTFADIHKRIGLSTNVSNVTTTNWFKRITRVMTENRFGTTSRISNNKMKAVYYTAYAEVEDYSASKEEELENA